MEQISEVVKSKYKSTITYCSTNARYGKDINQYHGSSHPTSVMFVWCGDF